MIYLYLLQVLSICLFQISLIKNLEERLLEYDKKLSKKGIEERRKERLAYVGISLNNVLPAKEPEFKVKGKKDGETDGSESERSDSGSDSGSTSDSDSEPIYQLRERRQAHSYRFNDYDELINSAIQVRIHWSVLQIKIFNL